LMQYSPAEQSLLKLQLLPAVRFSGSAGWGGHACSAWPLPPLM